MSTQGALQGCRVLEMSHAAGAVTGRILADLGAEVIKIEPPRGEAARFVEPLAACTLRQPTSLFWLSFNVSKRSIAIDLQSAQGRGEFAALARTADIVVTDFQRFDIAANDALAAIARRVNPRLVWTEIWPYGRGEPHEHFPAGDLVLQAMGGHLYLNGDVDRAPVCIGAPVAISQGGAEAASAALMAYYHRLRSGAGQRVEISIQECITWTLLNTAMTTQLLGIEEVRGGAVRRERANKYFTRLVWKCRDGYVHFGPVGGGGGSAREKSYAALVAWMAEEGVNDALLTDRDWNGAAQHGISQEDYDGVADIIGRFIATKTMDELMSRAVRDRILIAPVSSIPQVFSNPHLRAREYYSVLEDAGRGTALEYPMSWAHLTATPLRHLAPAPEVDADGQAIRAALARNTGEMP